MAEKRAHMKHIFAKSVILCFVISFLFAFFSLLFAAEKKFKEKRSTHFIIYYKEDVDVNFVNDIIDYAELYYEEIANNMGFMRYKFWLWDDRAIIYIYNDQQSYLRDTGQPEWSAACTDYREKKLWIYPHAAGFFDSILPHELGHIIFREFVGFGRNIPLWLDEGVASYQEKSKRYAAKNMVKDLIAKDKLLTIEQMEEASFPHDLERIGLEAFYAQSVSIIYFLIHDFDQDRFLTLCRRLKQGQDFDEALDETYYHFRNSADLYDKWLYSITNERY